MALSIVSFVILKRKIFQDYFEKAFDTIEWSFIFLVLIAAS